MRINPFFVSPFKCDVLLENFRPGIMEGWGLGPTDLKSDLVYTRISGYGQTGPMATLPGYASVAEAFGGFRCIETDSLHSSKVLNYF